MTAVGCCGLQLYNFGETVSFCFWDDSWQPDSYYDKIVKNRKLEYHTLCYGSKILKQKSILKIEFSSKFIFVPF